MIGLSNNDVNTTTQINADELMAEFDRESNTRRFSGEGKTVIKILFIVFAAFMFSTRFVTFPEQVRMSYFVGILMFLGFLLYPSYKKQSKKINYIPWYDYLLAVCAAAPYFYYATNYDYIVNKAAMIRVDTTAVIMGVIGIVAIFELCRRAVGLPILFVAGGFLAYAFYTTWMSKPNPELFKVVGAIVADLFYTTNGIFGSPINVCSTFIVFFIILGAFLEKTGIGNFFVDLANSVAGWASGGPAKVAVISSALEGMYSGSSVANTVGSGSITIPTMKKIGYKPEFAAAVEAAASTGGQIMPPIMGAAAFLMAEMIPDKNITYPVIAVAAILPAVLYFTGIFMMIHFEAKKLGLKGLPKESIPNFFKLLFSKGYLLIPIVILVAMMSGGTTAAKAACMAIISTLAIMLIMDVVNIIKNRKIKKLADLEIFLPVIAFVVLKFVLGMELENAGLLTGFFYILVALGNENTKESGKLAAEAFESGMKNTMGVAAACAIAGIVSGVVQSTGLASTLLNFVRDVSGGNLIVALFMTMIACIVLGMGVPTTANYVIMATTTAPILIELGLPHLAAHMFVFYFGIVADITPPVALAAYAGSAIAGSNPLKTGVTATKLAIAAFIIPYIFALNPKMLLIDAALYEIVIIVATALIGIFAISAGLEGYMFRKMKIYEILPLLAGGILLINPDIISSLVGLVIVGAITAIQMIEKYHDKHQSSKNVSNKVVLVLIIAAVLVALILGYSFLGGKNEKAEAKGPAVKTEEDAGTETDVAVETETADETEATDEAETTVEADMTESGAEDASETVAVVTA